MRVRLNTSAAPSTTAPHAARPATWAREVYVDTISPRRLHPSQKTWVSRWVHDELELCEADFRWAVGSWETIASKTRPPSAAEEGDGETFHLMIKQDPLDQSDHEFQIAVAVQTTRAMEGVGAGQEDVLVLVEVERQSHANWVKAGYGPHGTLCEAPMWDDVWGRLRQVWELEEEGVELSGDVPEGGLGTDVGENVGQPIQGQAD